MKEKDKILFMNTNQTYPNSTPMNNEEYHANTTHISKSGLDLLAQSPFHYWHKYLNPKRDPEERNQHFVVGSAVHAAILEPELFANEYWAVNDAAIIAEIGGAKPRATTKYKEWLAGQEAANVGREMLSADEFAHCIAMRDAVWAHPAAAMLLNDGYREQSFFLTEPHTEAPIKIRPDFLNPSIGWITDVKTTDDASPYSFGKSFYKFGYHKQAAMLLDGMREIDPFVTWKGIAFIAVEKNPPYAVGVYYATAAELELGQAEYRGNLFKYMECRAKNEWPAYSSQIEPIQRPGWVK